MKILSTRRFALWWQLARRWFEKQFSDQTDVIRSLISQESDKITPYLYDECSVEEVEHMFETQVLDGYVFIPSNAINSNGTMPVSVFEAITGLTPTE